MQMDDELNQEIGIRIKKRRKDKKMKQHELAGQLGISPKYMSAIECGRANMTIRLVMSVSEALEVTPDYLLLGMAHANNVPRDIVDNLRLCSMEDVVLVRNIVRMLVERNQKNFNENNRV